MQRLYRAANNMLKRICYIHQEKCDNQSIFTKFSHITNCLLQHLRIHDMIKLNTHTTISRMNSEICGQNANRYGHYQVL